MLTDTKLRSAKPREKAYRLYDQHGLYAEVSTAGNRLWRLKYRHGGKEKRLALGRYPEVGLARAREKALEARSLLQDGVDPGARRRARKVDSFEAVAREWHTAFSPRLAVSTAHKQLRLLERDLFPWLGAMPVEEVQPRDLLACLKRVDDRGARETSHRARQVCSQIFRYAIAHEKCSRDPAADVRGAIPPAQENHFPAITEPRALGDYLRVIDGFTGTFPVKCALALLPHLFVRPGELRQARWADLDLDTKEWSFTASKTRTEHLVPLSGQVVWILLELQPLTGDGRWLFPGGRSKEKPISDAALNASLRRLGYDTRNELTAHGFRATARTLLHERLGFPPEVIEHQLAHRVPDALGRAYNRTRFIEERRHMMQAWSNYLDKLREGQR